MLLRNALLKQSTLLYAVFLREMSSRFGFAILAKHEAKAAASKSVYALIITMELDKQSDHEEKSLHCFRIFYLLMEGLVSMAQIIVHIYLSIYLSIYTYIYTHIYVYIYICINKYIVMLKFNNT